MFVPSSVLKLLCRSLFNRWLCSSTALGRKRRPGREGRYRPSRSSWSCRSQGPHRGGWSQGQCCKKHSKNPVFNTVLLFTATQHQTLNLLHTVQYKMFLSFFCTITNLLCTVLERLNSWTWLHGWSAESDVLMILNSATKSDYKSTKQRLHTGFGHLKSLESIVEFNHNILLMR